jgi:hypothetical protein
VNGAYCFPLKGDLKMIDHIEFCFKKYQKFCWIFQFIIRKKSDLVRSIKQTVHSPFDYFDSLECFKLDIGADSNQQEFSRSGLYLEEEQAINDRLSEGLLGEELVVFDLPNSSGVLASNPRPYRRARRPRPSHRRRKR